MPTVQEITAAHVPYMDATLNEMSRLAKVFALSGRDAIVDTEILGHHIPKGTFVGILTTGPGQGMPNMPLGNQVKKRSEGGKMYKERLGTFDDYDIEDFNPDRWIKQGDGADEFDPNAGPFMPFSMGPRGCFGKKLARMQMSVMFTLILWDFKMLPLPDELNDDKEKIGLTRAPETVYVKLAKVGQ